MRNQGLTKNFVAGAAGTKYRIAKFGASDDQVLQSSAPADAHIGVFDLLGAESGKRCDVVMEGVAEVEYGGVVTRGDELTSDSQGRAIAAIPGTVAEVQTIGKAMVSGVAGDIGSVHLSTGSRANLLAITVDVADLVGANATVYRAAAPVAGTLIGVSSVLGGALATGDATITAAIGGVGVTDGVLTVTQAGSAVGDVDTATPSALATVAAGDVVSLTVGGTNTAAVGATVILLFAY